MADEQTTTPLVGVEEEKHETGNLVELGIPENIAKLFVDEKPADTNTETVVLEDKPKLDEVTVDNTDENKGIIDKEEEEETVSIFSTFNEEYKTDFVPDENKDIVTQLKDYVNHLVDNTKKSEQEATLNELKSNPLVKHILEGYSEEVVNHEQNYQTITAIDLNEATVEVKSSLYKQSLVSKGIDEEEADDMVATAIANDTLDAKAEKAKTGLENYFKSQVDAQKQIEDDFKVKETENYNKIVNEVTETIKKGFNGIVLPTKDVNDLIEYTTKVNPKTGLSKADENFYALPNEDKLTIDYIIKNNLLKTVATALKSPEKVNKLKEAINLNNKRPVVPNSSGTAKEVPMDLKELKAKLGIGK